MSRVLYLPTRRMNQKKSPWVLSAVEMAVVEHQLVQDEPDSIEIAAGMVPDMFSNTEI